MPQTSTRGRRSVRPTAPLLLVSVALTAIVSAAPAQAAIVPAAGETITVEKTAEQLGAPRAASAARLARAAAERYAGRLGVPARHRLRMRRELAPIRAPGAAPLRSFVFGQELAGRAVMWSNVVVHLRGRTVIDVSGAGVGGFTRVRSGTRSLSSARRIAMRAVPGAASTSAVRRIVWAGMPGSKGKRPAEAILVQVEPGDVSSPAAEARPIEGGLTEGWEGASPHCVVVDAATGEVIATWRGTAEESGDTAPAVDPGDADDGPAAVAGRAGDRSILQTSPGETRLIRVRDAQGRTASAARAVAPDLHSRTVRWPESQPPGPFTFDFGRVFRTGSPFGDAGLNTLFGNADLLYGIFCVRTAQICQNGKGFWDVFGNTNLPDDVLGLHTSGSRKIHIDPTASRDFDVLGHEMGHEFAQQALGDTANEGEIGAMGEAYADISAFLAGGNRTIFTNVVGVAPQSLESPFRRMATYSTNCQDVHLNARIIDRAFILARDATSFEIMQETFREAMKGAFFSSTTGFRGFREGLMAFARTRFGNTTANKIGTAFDTVGVTSNVVVPACK